MAFDPKLYHPKWSLIRALISHRDRNHCKRCQAPHRLWVWRMKNRSWRLADEGAKPRSALRRIQIVCTVAHLNWDRNDNTPQNLALLCQQCHFDHDRPQHMHKHLAYGRRNKGPKTHRKPKQDGRIPSAQ